MSLDPRSVPADELLQALTVGDLAADDPAVAARLAKDPVLLARWRKLAATRAALRELDGGLRDEPGNGADDAARRDAAAAAVRSFRRASRQRRWLAPAAAAALLALVLWLTRGEPPAHPDPNLGGAPTGVMTPDGVWPPGAPFGWPAVKRAAGYRVQVQLPDGAVLVLPNGADGELLTATGWQPTEAQRAALPEQFTWRVVAFDANNDSIDTSAWVPAKRQ